MLASYLLPARLKQYECPLHNAAVRDQYHLNLSHDLVFKQRWSESGYCFARILPPRLKQLLREISRGHHGGLANRISFVFQPPSSPLLDSHSSLCLLVEHIYKQTKIEGSLNELSRLMVCVCLL